MKTACGYMLESDMMPFLSEREEWDLLAELHPNNVKGAEVWAQIGEFQKAGQRLESGKSGCDLGPEQLEMLLSYYMKVQEFVLFLTPL